MFKYRMDEIDIANNSNYISNLENARQQFIGDSRISETLSDINRHTLDCIFDTTCCDSDEGADWDDDYAEPYSDYDVQDWDYDDWDGQDWDDDEPDHWLY